MIYVFKDGVLLRTQAENYPRCISEWNVYSPKLFPTDSFMYSASEKVWYVKRTGAHVRPLPEGMVPKELQVCLLLLGIH